jgi:hypothetical protein
MLCRGPTKGHAIMDIGHLEASVIGADGFMLDDIMRACWRSLAAGEISDADASSVSDAVEARRTVLKAPRPLPTPTLPMAPRRPPVSRDRHASRQRRRRVASSGAMPPAIAANFTEAERAALAIVAGEIRSLGRCELCIDAIAARAGVSRTTVQNALRVAGSLSLINVVERRRPGRKNLTNIISIISTEWRSWLRLGHRVQTRERDQYKQDSLTSKEPPTGRFDGAGRGFRASGRQSDYVQRRSDLLGKTG